MSVVAQRGWHDLGGGLGRRPQLARGFLKGRGGRAVALLAMLALAPIQATSVPPTDPSESQAPARQEPVASSQAVRFEPNLGQVDPRVRYLARGDGYTLFLTRRGAVITLQGSGAAQTQAAGSSSGGSARRQSAVVRMQLSGAQARPDIKAVNALPGTSNYFVGDDPHRWRTGVPGYGRVVYSGVYPGIDLIFRGSRTGELEYDFRVGSGADPSAIRMTFSGPAQRKLTRQGDLMLTTPAGKLRQARPYIFQRTRDGRVEVPGSFVLGERNQVRFRMATYDTTRPLIIDPTVTYATPLGGTASDIGTAIAVDLQGTTYLTGNTTSSDFPGAENSAPGGTDVFVSALDPEIGGPDSLLYSIYLGGTGDDYASGIEVDGDGNAYLTGETTSSDFPTTVGAFERDNPGGSDVFLARLGVGGATPSLGYSSYFGGSGDDSANDVSASSSGLVAVAGRTTSADLPVTSGSWDEELTGPTDAFVAKVDTNLTGTAGRIYATYVGGGNQGFVDGFGGDEYALGLALDADGAAYITGVTSSRDFPTAGPSPIQAHRPLCNFNFDDDVPPTPWPCSWTGFLTKLDPDGSSLSYSTYLGGNASGHAVAVDMEGNAYITGETSDIDFPGTDTSPIQPNKPSPWGGTDGFVAKIDQEGSEVVYASYLGTSSESPEASYDIQVDAEAHAYVTGVVADAGFPTYDPIQGSSGGQDDIFLTKIAPDGHALAYSTYIGGRCREAGYGIAVDLSGNAYVTGYTRSDDFRWVNPVEAFAENGCQSHDAAFVLKVNPAGVFPVVDAVSPSNGPDAGGTEVLITGNRLSGTTSVEFGGSPASFEVVSDNEVVAESPRHPPGEVDVEVTTPGGVSAVTAATRYVYEPAVPEVTSVLPQGGPVEGGTKVTIAGLRMGEATGVEFGGATAAEFSVVSDTEIRATTPPHPQGEAIVTVTNAAGPSFMTEGSRFVYGGTGRWAPTGPMAQNRWGHGAVLLPEGKVLVTGGGYDDAAGVELYDPLTGKWSSATCLPGEVNADCPAPMLAGQAQHSSTLLSEAPCGDNCGKVLVTGYEPLFADKPGELYDPATGSWKPSTMSDRGIPVLLRGAGCGSNCGKVLFLNSHQTRSFWSPRASLYDPATDSRRGVTQGFQGRYFATSTLLEGDACGDRCGQVLTLGWDPRGLLPDPPFQLFDPAQEKWQNIPGELISRRQFTATLLQSGRVLVTGGVKVGHGTFTLSTPAVEIFDPYAADADSAAVATDPLITPRWGHSATRLPDGSVLVAGGTRYGRTTNSHLELAEVYDPRAAKWYPAGAMQVARFSSEYYPHGFTATLLSSDPDEFEADLDVCGENCGKVLVVGYSRIPELYTPAPWIKDVTPASVGPGGGTPVTITGSGFTNGISEVRFGKEIVHCPSAACRVESYFKLEVTTPPGITTGPLDVTVVTDGGPSRPSGRTRINVGAPGVIADLTAVPTGSTEAELGFTVPPTLDSSSSGAAKSFIVKQSRVPIGNEADFRRARTLCSGVCGLSPTPGRPGDIARLRVRDLDPDTTYYFAVKVLDGLGNEGPMSNVARVTMELVAPGSVDDLEATPLSEAAVMLTFSATGANDSRPPPAADYVIKFDDEPILGEEDFDAARELCGGLCSFAPARVGDPIALSISDLKPGTTYYFALRAVDGKGIGPLSNIAEATLTASVSFPTVVTDLEGAAISSTRVKLTFSAPALDGLDSSPASDYAVKISRARINDESDFDAARSLCGGVCRFSPRSAGDRLSLTVTELNPATTYFFLLRPHDDAGNLGPMSNVAQVETSSDVIAPGRVVDLTARGRRGNKIALKFSAVGSDAMSPPPVTEYVVKLSNRPIASAAAFERARSLCGGTCIFSPASVGDRLRLTVADVTPSKTYYFAVRARDPWGNLGPRSKVVKARSARR